MMGKDDVNTFLSSLKRQEQEERLNRTKPKPNVKLAAKMFVMTADKPLDDIEIDHNNSGFFDDLFYKEVAQEDAKRSQKQQETDPSLQLPDSNPTGHNFIEDQYFRESLQTCVKTLATPDSDSSFKPKIEKNSDMGLIDSQYFDTETSKVPSKNCTEKSHSSVAQPSAFSTHQEDFSHIDTQYFAMNGSRDIPVVENSMVGQSQNIASWQDVRSNESSSIDSPKLNKLSRAVSHDYEVTKELMVEVESQHKDAPKQKNSHGRRKKDDDSPMRRSKIGVDTINSYLPDLDTKPSYEVVDILMDSIVFHDEKLVCINKPYSLPTQGGPGVHHSVYKYLSNISKRLQYDGSLHLCHRLDKDASGVLLLAKGEEQAVKIKRRFETRDIEKKYMAITFGVPKPASGVIDIPIAEESLVQQHYRSILLPITTKTRRRGAHLAQTEYRVLRYNETAALVELQPFTGRKHQLRVHLADGLSTPILGDHKYSHRDKLAPQRLTKDILAKFNMEQSQVRNMPMHLHARSLLLPGYFPNGKGLVLSAMIPKFFSFSIKRLKFFR